VCAGVLSRRLSSWLMMDVRTVGRSVGYFFSVANVGLNVFVSEQNMLISLGGYFSATVLNASVLHGS